MPYVQLGKLYTMAARLDEARKAFKAAVEAAVSKEEKAAAHRAFAAWLIDQNEVDIAAAHVLSAEEDDPNSVQTRSLKGLVYRFQKKFPEAEQIFLRLLQETPSNYIFKNQLALVQLEIPGEESKKRGLANAQELARLAPDATNAQATYGWALFCNGRIEDADKQLGQAAYMVQGQVSPDTGYYIAVFWNYKANQKTTKPEEKTKLQKDALEVLNRSLKVKGGYIYKEKAETLMRELEAALKK